MWKPSRSVLLRIGSILLVLGLTVVGCAADSPHSDGAVNFYESLDLSTPIATVETFSDAFARNDFMTVWLAFDIQAQFAFEGYFNLLQYRYLLRTDAVPDMPTEIVAAFSPSSVETTDRWNIFSQLMMIADDHDAFLIDLSGEVATGDASPVGDDVEVVSVVEGIDGEVRFRLVQSPSGRWRVRQVIVPGGAEDILPWVCPSTLNVVSQPPGTADSRGHCNTRRVCLTVPIIQGSAAGGSRHEIVETYCRLASPTRQQ